MEDSKLDFKELIFFEILFLGVIILTYLKVLDSKQTSFIIVALISYFLIKSILSKFLNFILQIRNSNLFPDNRTASFLTFDFLKSILITLSLIVILVLGINKVLNNETIATLLGGLVGSLLTLRGSYTDIKLKDFKKADTKSNE